jgi:tRNA pseudouridine38-40 synthase
LRYFIELAYLGTSYHGWQSQTNATSVQELIEQGLSSILSSEVSITGSSRTDTGVHAEQQYAHFDFSTPLNTSDLSYKLNALLPPDIFIKRIFQVKDSYHSRFDAIFRRYEYRITSVKDPFHINQTYYFRTKLNLDLMNRGCEIFLKNNNFQSFSKVKTEVNHYNCNLSTCKWKQSGKVNIFEVQANRFLRGMVRAMVGTLIDIGLGKLSVSKLQGIIESKDRRLAGRAAPAKGLFLVEVGYPKDYFNE